MSTIARYAQYRYPVYPIPSQTPKSYQKFFKHFIEPRMISLAWSLPQTIRKSLLSKHSSRSPAFNGRKSKYSASKTRHTIITTDSHRRAVSYIVSKSKVSIKYIKPYLLIISAYDWRGSPNSTVGRNPERSLPKATPCLQEYYNSS